MEGALAEAEAALEQTQRNHVARQEGRAASVRRQEGAVAGSAELDVGVTPELEALDEAH